jgi:hypothetical protein
VIPDKDPPGRNFKEKKKSFSTKGGNNYGLGVKWPDVTLEKQRQGFYVLSNWQIFSLKLQQVSSCVSITFTSFTSTPVLSPLQQTYTLNRT